MPRVAIYARYSSDNQRDASIEDQISSEVGATCASVEEIVMAQQTIKSSNSTITGRVCPIISAKILRSVRPPPF